MKKLFAVMTTHVAAFTLGACALVACREDGINLKIFFLDSSTGTLVRKQENEIYTCYDKEVDAFRCLSEQDFTALMNYCQQ